MALITNYATLQSEALDWMTRAGQSGNAPTWVQLAEARLNRELGAIETDTTLTGTLNSNAISISALNIVQPIALFLAETGKDQVAISPATEGTFAVSATSGKPTKWSIDGTNINFDCPLDSAYPFRFRYRQELALATTDPNWLLTNHPDIYLAATLMWGAGYNEDWSNGSIWKSVLDEGIASVRHTIAQNKRATLSIDPGLLWKRTYSLANWTNDG
jgi:hypothetical protein